MKTCKKYIVAGLSAAVALSFSAAAVAQEGEESLEEIIVTGSNVTRSADSPRPIVTMDRGQIQNEQSLSVAEVFRDMSITQGNFNGSGGVTVNVDNNSSAINLRGLGARATLTLLNGRRHTMSAVAAGNDGFTVTDPNALAPAIMLRRIDVLTDGASAIYGSDAVAGVVNLVTDNEFEGIEFEYGQNVIDRSSDTEHSIATRFGAQGTQTSVVAGIEHVSRPETLTIDIFDDSRLRSARTGGAGNPITLREYDPSTGRQSGRFFPDPLCESDLLGGEGLGGGEVKGGRCHLNLALDRGLISDTTRTTALTVVTHEFDNGVTAEFEVGGASSEYSSLLQTSPVPAPISYTSIDNPSLADYISDGLLTPGSDYYRTFGRMRISGSEDFNPKVGVRKLDTRAVASFNGEFTDTLDWTFSYTTSRATYDLANRNTIFDRLQNALLGYGGASCNLNGGGASGYGPDALSGTADDSTPDSNCSWYSYTANQWLASPGDATYNSPELRDFIYADATRTGKSELDTIDLLLRGNPSDFWGYAVGYQQRTQDFSTSYDAITNAGGFAFASAPVSDFSGTIESDSYFAEAVLFPTDALELQFAVRYEEYDTGQDSTDPKIGFLWTPSDNFSLRGTWGTSFRIANPPQQFGGSSGQGSGIGLSVDGGVEFQSSSLGAFTRGNPELDPEESENYSFGFTWGITDSLTLDVSYWNFEFENLIFRENPDIVALQDVEADGIFGNDPRVLTRNNESLPVTPSGQGDLNWLAPLGSAGIDIVEGYALTFTNQEFLNTSGIDFSIDYDFEAFGGDVGLSLDGTYTLDYEIEGFIIDQDPGAANALEIQSIDGVGSANLTNNGAPIAEWKGSARFNYRLGNNFAQLTVRHTSGVAQIDSTIPSENKDFNTLDLIYSYDFDDLFGIGPIKISAGLINLTDKEPPFDGEELTTAQTRLYDPRGRVYRFTFSKSF